MTRRLRQNLLAFFAVTLVIMTVAPAAAQPATKGKAPKLFSHLPAFCNTPDGMALLPSGKILLSVPNCNDVTAGAFIAEIDSRGKARKYLELPQHPVTKQPVGPLGICLAPNGDLFLADYQMTGQRQSRVLRISIRGGRPMSVQPVVTGFHVSNAVAVHDGYLYVSETQIDPEATPATSGVMRFSLDELKGEPIALAEDEVNDPHLLGIIEVHDEELPLGADGLCFDRQGNLYIGNFADGTVHRFQFDEQGNVKTNEVFAQAPFMKSADGLAYDAKTGVIYVADSRANAIQKVLPDGSVKTLAKNGDTDGLDGGMDQPCEPLLLDRTLIVSNMDWPVPGTINQEYNAPATLSIIELD